MMESIHESAESIHVMWSWMNNNLATITALTAIITAIATVVLIFATISTGKRAAAQTEATNRSTDVAVAAAKAAYLVRMMDAAANLQGVRKNNAIWNLVELAEEWGAGRHREEIVAFFREQAARGDLHPDDLPFESFLVEWDRHGIGPRTPLQFDLRTERGDEVSLWGLMKQAFGLWRRRYGPAPKVVTEDFRTAAGSAAIWLQDVADVIRETGHNVMGPTAMVDVHAAHRRQWFMVEGHNLDWSVFPRRVQRAQWRGVFGIIVPDSTLQMSIVGVFTKDAPKGEWQVGARMGAPTPSWKWRSNEERWFAQEHIEDELKSATKAVIARLPSL